MTAPRAVVDFSIFPHLDYPGFPKNTMADAEPWAAAIGTPAYAIDEQTAIPSSTEPPRWCRKGDGRRSGCEQMRVVAARTVSPGRRQCGHPTSAPASADSADPPRRTSRQ